MFKFSIYSKFIILQTAYSQVQLNANGQPTLLPMIAAHNGFHPAHANQHLQAQQAAFLAADPTTTALLHQVQAASGLSPGAAAATANGLLAPQQRTDRLLVNRTILDKLYRIYFKL